MKGTVAELNDKLETSGQAGYGTLALKAHLAASSSVPKSLGLALHPVEDRD